MGTFTHVLWTTMLFTGGLMTDILHGRGFPVYVTALAASIGAGVLSASLAARQRAAEVPSCGPGTGKHRRCVSTVSREAGPRPEADPAA